MRSARAASCLLLACALLATVAPAARAERTAGQKVCAGEPRASAGKLATQRKEPDRPRRKLHDKAPKAQASLPKVQLPEPLHDLEARDASDVQAALPPLPEPLHDLEADASDAKAALPPLPEPLEQDGQDGPDAAQPLSATLHAGVAVGVRQLRVPTVAGERRFASGFFPGIDLALRVHAPLSKHVLFGAAARYHSSVSLSASETPALGARKQSDVRSHQLQAGITPGYRFTESEQSAALVLFAGWGVHALQAVPALTIPDFTWHGPLLRLELHLPIAGLLQLRVAPELFMPAFVSDALHDAAALSRAELSVGGEVELSMRLWSALSLELAYRQSRIRAQSTWGPQLIDTEHLAALRAVLHF